MPTNRHSARSARSARSAGRLAVAGLLTAAVGLLASTGVYAGLSARSTAAGSVASGTLDLTLSPDVGVGFSTFTGPMAPGDARQRVRQPEQHRHPGVGCRHAALVSGAPSTALTDGSIAGRGLTVDRLPVLGRLGAGHRCLPGRASRPC